MVGDGRCAFYAMLHQVGLSPSVESVDALRCVLWNTCPEQHRQANANLLVEKFTDLLAWGSTDNFGLFSLVVNSRLCVHVLSDQGEEMRTTAYSLCEDGETTMHVRWTTAAAGHVDSYEGVNFPRDRDVRVLNFVNFLQTKIFEIKGEGKVNYDSTSVLPNHEFVNRSGLKLLSILAKFPVLRTEGRVLDLCGAPGGFLSVLRAVNADVLSVSGPAIAYDGNPSGTYVMDITDDQQTRRLKTESFALVVADGADDNSYKDETVLLAEIRVIERVLRKGGNCVIKISNFFTQMKHVEAFVKKFSRVICEKPDFSLTGNTEVYLVCFDYGKENHEYSGVDEVRTILLCGLMRYYECAVNKSDRSDLRKAQMLIDVLRRAALDVTWRVRSMVGGVDIQEIFPEPIIAPPPPPLPPRLLRPVGVSVVQPPIAESSDCSSIRLVPRGCESSISSEGIGSGLVVEPISSASDCSNIEFEPNSYVSSSPSVAKSCEPSSSAISVDTCFTVLEEEMSIPTTPVDSSPQYVPLSTQNEKGDDVGCEEQKGKEEKEEGKKHFSPQCVPLSTKSEKMGCEEQKEDEEEMLRKRVESYIDEQVLCEVPRDTISWKDKIRRTLGIQAKECVVASTTQVTTFGIKTDNEISAVGRRPDGKKIKAHATTKKIYEKRRTTQLTTAYTTRDVSVSASGDVLIHNPGKIYKRKIKSNVCTRGTNTDMCGDGGGGAVEQVTRISTESESVASVIVTNSDKPEQKEEERDEEEEEIDKIGEVIASIDKVNLAANEPLRATAMYCAVEAIKQDILISYAWRVKNGVLKLSKCFKYLFGESEIKEKKLKALRLIASVSNGTDVYQTAVNGVRVMLLALPNVNELETSLLHVLARISECVESRLRVSVDVLTCKDYSVDCFRLIELSNIKKNLIMVLYLHNQYTRGRAFGSPYLYHGSGNAELFPQLTDDDLGLIRCPALLDDNLLENRYKNSMIEYLHTSTFAQGVLAVQLKRHYASALRSGTPDVDVLRRLATKGIFFYDNHTRTTISGDVAPYGWAFAENGCGGKFYKYCEEKGTYDGSDVRYYLFSRETRTLLSEETARRLREIDLTEVRIPKITWINGPPGCGKTELALRTHKRPERGGDVGDLILTVTKESCESLRKRVKGSVDDKYLKTNYRTVASLLLNGSKKEFDKVIIDEALMVHAGALAFSAHIVAAKELVIIGDIHQIPYIDRDHVTSIQYASPDRFCSVSETLVRTHRCPIDVTYMALINY